MQQGDIAEALRAESRSRVLYPAAFLVALCVVFWLAVAVLCVVAVVSALGAVFSNGFVGVLVLLLAIGLSVAVFMPVWKLYQWVMDPVALTAQENGVVWVDDRPEYAAMVAEVHALAQAAGLPAPPRVGVQPGEVNAMAVGFVPSRSGVIIGGGLMERLSADELRAVIGHEIGHLLSRDCTASTMIMVIEATISQGVVRPMMAVLGFFGIGASIGGATAGDRDTRSSMMLIGLLCFAAIAVLRLAVWIFHVCVRLFQSGHSRGREFRADRIGALLTSKAAMIGALRSLDDYASGIREVPADPFAAFQFINMKAASAGKGGGLFDTHPPIAARISSLDDWRPESVPGPLPADG